MSDPTTTIVSIAASLRRHSPGALPVLGEEDGRLCMIESSGRGEYASNWHVPLPDDIARHVLIAAMVLDINPKRLLADGWVVGVAGPTGTLTHHEAMDRDHNNDQLLSLYFAWKFAKGIADA